MGVRQIDQSCCMEQLVLEWRMEKGVREWVSSIRFDYIRKRLRQASFLPEFGKKLVDLGHGCRAAFSPSMIASLRWLKSAEPTNPRPA